MMVQAQKTLAEQSGGRCSVSASRTRRSWRARAGSTTASPLQRCASTWLTWRLAEHTHSSREILGPDKLLCVEQKVCLETDPSRAREAGRKALAMYAALPNYRNNWKRLGFTEAEIENGGSDKLIDALLGWGDANAIAQRIQERRDAGATHVCIQPLKAGAPGELDWALLEAMAPSG